MIIKDNCDYCGKEVEAERAHLEYERKDGDINILCADCLREQLEAEYAEDEARGHCPAGEVRFF